MTDILVQYEKIDPATFAVLSSFLTISLFFKFNRFWSVRNLDVLLLILFAPGLLLVSQGEYQQDQARISFQQAAAFANPDTDDRTQAEIEESQEESIGRLPASRSGRKQEFYGYLILWIIGGVFLVRLLLDSTMVRRPLLEPNLTSGGLLFLSMSMFALMSANVILAGQAYQLRVDTAAPAAAESTDEIDQAAEPQQQDPLDPGFAPLERVVSIPVSFWLTGRGDSGSTDTAIDHRLLAATAILGHLLIMLGMIAAGFWHFHNVKMGIGAATIYLLLPSTYQMAGQVDHVIPGVLLVWAIVLYPRPLVAGVLLGLSLCIYYPIFLIPLWVSFYVRRGLLRYAVGLLIGAGLLVALLRVQVTDPGAFIFQLRRMFGVMWPRMEGLGGIWGFGWDPVYRMPLLAAFIAISGTLALWPPQKNLGTLLACSAAVMVATRFWNGSGGGLNMAWYVPLILLTIVRPNLEDRIAINVIGPGWPRRRARGSS